MGLDYDLYYLAVAAENRYLASLNTAFKTNFASIEDGLNHLFGLKKNILTSREQEDNKVLNEITDRMLSDIVSHIPLLIDAEGIFYQKKAQIKKADTSIEKSGYLDEVKTMKIAGKAIKDVAKKYNFDFDIDGKNANNADFTINLYSYDNYTDNLGHNWSYRITSSIPFENKLSLQHFHITKNSGINKGREVANLIMSQMEDRVSGATAKTMEFNAIKNSEIYGAMVREGELNEGIDQYKFITVNLTKGEFKKMLACSLLYQKLKDSYPVFITNQGGKIEYKLCSEVIYDCLIGDKMSLLVEGLNNEYLDELDYNKLSEEVGQLIENKILKSISYYELWYGK